jgi:hypothetical protein
MGQWWGDGDVVVSLESGGALPGVGREALNKTPHHDGRKGRAAKQVRRGPPQTGLDHRGGFEERARATPTPPPIM